MMEIVTALQIINAINYVILNNAKKIIISAKKNMVIVIHIIAKNLIISVKNNVQKKIAKINAI